jgi:DNA-binding NtrC family response regulator
MENQKQSVSIEHKGAKLTLEYSKIPFPLSDALGVFERSLISHFLDQNNGIKARVARDLMLNRTTLVEKCRKFGFRLKK